MMYRLLSFIYPLILALLAGQIAAQKKSAERLASSKPQSGVYVETKRGFMLPYVEEIPETGATFTMIPIPAGDIEVKDISGAVATIAIEPFWMGAHEVTWQEYASYMGLYRHFRKEGPSKSDEVSIEHIDAVTAPTEIYDPQTRLEFATRPNCPAASMTQFAARQYTKWLSLCLDAQYRLPSEAEWTYACLAPSNHRAEIPTPIISSSALSATAVFGREDLAVGPETVGSRQPNGFGIYDMLGNVSEWVLDSNAAGSNILRLAPGNYSVETSIGHAPTRYAALACGGGCWEEADGCQPMSRIVADRVLWNNEANIPLSVTWLANPDRDRTIGFRIVRALKELPELQEMQSYWLPDSEDLRLDVVDKLEGGRGAIGRVGIGEVGRPSTRFPYER